MKSFLPFLSLLLALVFSAFAEEPKPAKPYVRYAQFIDDTPVELSDGAHWVMDKGDCFPIHMFKEQRTKLVLQLAGATFWTDAKRVRLLEPREEEMALQSYRKNLDNYLKSQARKMREKLEKQ